ncbi:MAG: glycosyltransferase family 4 protein [Gemmatimonadota bacterium]|nr:glycosyltransferase family 4 protein [Gemmatimonadota bacterium]
MRNWSGTLFFSREAISRAVGPVTDLSGVPFPLLPLRLARRLVLATTGKRYNYDHEPALARFCGAYFSRLVARTRPDVIFSPAGSTSLAHLDTEVPIVYFTDGPWSVIRNYNPAYANVVGRTAASAEELEQRSLRRADVVLVSSQWARDAVVRYYGTDPAKVYNVGIGANLPDPPTRKEVLPRRKADRTIRLLMVAVQWESKGGPIAREALQRLLEMGYDARLTVVGCSVPAADLHPRMEVVPFLNKQVLADRLRLEQLWKTADFFILPTRAEAAGVVFCEASAYAIPSLAPRTGGVPSLVVDGRNGWTLPCEARGDCYARRIAKLVDEPERYARLCESSRDEFEQRLSWDAWGGQVARIIRDAFPHLAGRLPNSVPAIAAR